AFVTNTLSCTTSPADAVVITAWLALWMSVRTDASAHSFCAGAELAPVPLVVLVSVTVLTTVVTVAEITDVPGVADVGVTVHEPVAPTVEHGLPAIAPGPAVTLTATCVPAGAFTNPLPGFTFTCTVSTWSAPTGLMSVAGVIWMFASTKVFTAGPLFGAT